MTEADKAQERLAAEAASGSALGRLLLDMWQRTRIDWGFVSDRLADAFRRERRLTSSERRFASETLYGMIRHLRRLDEALRAGGLRPGGGAPDRERLLAYLVLEGGLEPRDAAQHVPAIDWVKVAGIDAVLEREKDPARRVARLRSIPDWLAERLVAERGPEEADRLAAALGQRAPMTLRANLLKVTPEELVARLAAEGIAAHAGTLATTSVIVDGRTNLFATEAFRAGCFEAQDEGSQLIAELVAPPPKSRVVDYCAGAGGKTLALAGAMRSAGRITACDVDRRKLVELKKRARRAGASNIESVELVGEGMPPPLAALEARAQRVLVDAPCSGIGALRRNPEARWRLDDSTLARMPELQLGIARRALDLVAPGGRLIYATCTLLRAENQAVVERLMAERSDLELVAPKEIWSSARAAPLTDATGRFMELLPHRHGTDGFFAAVLRRKA
jgi:16S rRNA (cytosine967-C5)-methyltransferase